MLMRKSIGALCAAGAMATAIGLAGCADTGTGYASGYGSGYAGSDYITAGDYGPGYDDGGVWLGGLYGGGGYGWWGGHDHDRDHAYRWGGFVGTSHVGSAVSHGGLGGGVMHASASPGGFGGAGHFGGGHFGGGFGGGGHGGGGGGHR